VTMGEPAAPPGDDADALFQRGQQAFAGGDLSGAMALFQQALEQQPDHVMANFQIGQVARQTGNRDLARQFFGKAVGGLRTAAYHEGDDHGLWLMLACAVAASGDGADVARVVADARDYTGDDAQFLHALGSHLTGFDLALLGLELLEAAQVRAPGDPAICKTLGQALAALGRNEEAIAQLQQALAQMPQDPTLYDALAGIYGGSNLTADEAADWYRRGLAVEATPQRYLMLAERLRIQARFDAAIEALQEGLARCAPTDPRTRRDMLHGLGVNLHLSGRRTEAMTAWEQALAQSCRGQATHTAHGLADICIDVRLLWRLGRKDEARAILQQLKGEVGPTDFVYASSVYSQDIAAAIARLQALVSGRDVFVLQHGPSMRTLDAHIEAFAGLDVCFATAHSFAFFEQGMLARIDARVELAMVSNPMVLRGHSDQIAEFLDRDADNLLLSNRYCFEMAGADWSDSRAVEARHGDKLLLFPPPDTVLVPIPASPLHFPLCNTLSCTLPFLVLGGARRVFLFGVDGVGRDAAGGHERFGSGDAAYRFEATDDREKRVLAENLLVDTLTFDFAADLGIQGIASLFDLPVPPIYTVSPDSHITLFPRIDIDRCIAMLRQPAS